MDEKKMAEEFANIWKALGENSGAIIDTNKDLKKICGMQKAIVRGVNNHIDACNNNFDVLFPIVRKFNKYAARQNVLLFAGIGGFLYLYKKIQKLEDATKKE